MVKLQSNQIALVTLILLYFLGNSVVKTSEHRYENHSSLRTTNFWGESLINAGSLFSAVSRLVSEFRQMVLKDQPTSFSPYFHFDPLIQMTPNPGD
jgi:hypothetical protein